jgi:ribosomal RNA methyltransferase Nop2
MKKQGPPPTLDESKISSFKKRKAGEPEHIPASGRKRRRSGNVGQDTINEKANGSTKLGKGGHKDQEKLKMKAPPQKQPSRPSKPTKLQLQADDITEDDDDDDDAADLLRDEFEDLDGADEGSTDLDQLENDLNNVDALEVEESDDSAFDSEEEDRKATFSEDEDLSDAEEKLTAANIEGLSHRLDSQKADEAAQAQQELEEAALQTNIAEDRPTILDDENSSAPLPPHLAPDLQLLRTRITDTIRVLDNFSTLAEPGRSRSDYTSKLLSDISTYYGYSPFLAQKLLSLFPPLEAFSFFEANETPRPVVIRTNTLRTNRRSLAQALINRGVVLEPLPGKWSKVGLQIFSSPVPLGATPEYLAGHYILQAASSFLPVIALAPQEGERVLDMAAAPGGKTTYISALMRNTGCVFANDANKIRAKGLIGNIHRLGAKNTVVSSLDAQEAFPKILGGFDRVLLDAPCSGTGVIAKDPSVKTSKTERDFLALPHMQKKLLLAAIDSTDHASKTGGYIVYSTCSVTVEENEQVVQYVLRKRPNVRIVETGLTFGSEGFKSYIGKVFDKNMHKTRRYYPHRQNVDGFFVCKLKKFGPSPSANTAGATSAKSNGDIKSESETVDRRKERTASNGEAVEDEPEQDDFGGFNDEEDANIIERSVKKRLTRKGINPYGVPGKKKS